MGWLLPERYVEPARFMVVNRIAAYKKQQGRTRATKDSLMREVTIVLFPTPSEL